MCNAKPGQRCQSDSFNVLRSKIQRFGELADKIGSNHVSVEKIQMLSAMSDEIADQKAMFYASAGAQANPSESINKVASLNKKVALDGINFMDHDERRLFLTGKYLSKMQEFADRHRTQNKCSQLETARAMTSISGFDAVVRGYERKLEEEESEKILFKAPLDQRQPAWDEDDEIIEVRNRYSDHLGALREAFRVASNDADGVILRDKKKNTKNYDISSPNSPARLFCWKTFDGSFDVDSTYEVKASSREEAENIASRSLTWGNAKQEVSPKPGDPSTYVVKAKYTWQGSENVEDLYRHHLNFWNPPQG